MSISSRIREILDAKLMRELTTLAGDTAEQARQNAAWSDRIPDAISVGSVTKEDDGSLHIVIKLDIEKAPHALAFEYGSGEHGEKGQKYPIYPKNTSALAFPESRWPQFEPPVISGRKMIGMIDGKFLLRFVEHPGVEARPFLHPAIDAKRKTIRNRFIGLLSKSYKEAVISVEVIK